MKAMGRAVVIIFLCFWQNSFGQETNAVAVSDWSKATGGTTVGVSDAVLRGRLFILEGHSPAYAGANPETQIYVEIQNVSTTSDPVRFYFDPQNGIQAELRDVRGEPAPEIGSGGDGGFPSAHWITLPYDSTIRLRASWYAHGTSSRERLNIPFFNEIAIKAGDTNDYYLSVKFRSAIPKNYLGDTNGNVWQGTLTFPVTKLASSPRR